MWIEFVVGSRSCSEGSSLILWGFFAALVSHQCRPGSIPGVDAICGLSLLLVLVLDLRVVSPASPVFLSPQNVVEFLVFSSCYSPNYLFNNHLISVIICNNQYFVFLQLNLLSTRCLSSLFPLFVFTYYFFSSQTIVSLF